MRARNATPSAMCFTANSTGHMMRYLEWYEGKEEVEVWALKQAMYTIQHAAPTKSGESDDPITQGRATWLRPLNVEGKPLVGNISCPFSAIPKPLVGMDWTKYEGLLHTDHAVREEFFQDREVAPTSSRPYLMDFTYLYDKPQGDFVDFSLGKQFSEEHIYNEIGKPESWSHRESGFLSYRTEEEAAKVAAQLAACQGWEASPWHVHGEDVD
jgi:hypothetical protein